ncbi:sugar phosphate isomerase/epimerase family protein [Actinoplanes couchii]|uniref:Inosose dehydratase n=1 Tax=Actinoplanes couchii TaxID=403638 RepID=A0ABQ3XND7_9ACTN|nr:sugar phosphate isomerase/epimerase [Actinoplanes couchii]MDR6318055.1 inosose dehydratase [Actinoplanes couchii]GID60028.1 inosose dehydratase [Actinoplanes couchii]
MATIDRFGLNPLPWILGDMGYHLNADVIRTALRDAHAVGFRSMTIEIPAEMGTAEYRALFDQAGIGFAPGYFSAAFHDPAQHEAAIDGIRRHAEAHLELGVDTAFIADDLIPQRIATPAVGAGEDPRISAIIADGMAAAAEAAAQLGVRYGLHPHVGSLVETESETRAVLDRTRGSVLGFGPDTGHLRWAGATPEKVIADYADRVIALHVKDVNLNGREKALSTGADYMVATGGHHVWTEPGRGSIDFAAVFAALPEDWSGWTILEVDVPHLPTPVESTRASFGWITAQPFYGLRR